MGCRCLPGARRRRSAGDRPRPRRRRSGHSSPDPAARCARGHLPAAPLRRAPRRHLIPLHPDKKGGRSGPLLISHCATPLHLTVSGRTTASPVIPPDVPLVSRLSSASEDDPALRRTGPGYGQQTAQPFRQKRQACPAQRRVAGTAMRTGKHRPVPIHEDLLFCLLSRLSAPYNGKEKDAFHRAALTAALLPLTLVRPRTKNARIPVRRPHACHLT